MALLSNLRMRQLYAALPAVLLSVLLIGSVSFSAMADDDEKDPFWSKDMDAPPDVSAAWDLLLLMS